jgi:hypothetical protein
MSILNILIKYLYPLIKSTINVKSTILLLLVICCLGQAQQQIKRSITAPTLLYSGNFNAQTITILYNSLVSEESKSI